MNLNTIEMTSVKYVIQQVYKKLRKSINFDDITFKSISSSFSSYMINDEEYGYIHIQKRITLKNLTNSTEMDDNFNINISTSDNKIKFPFFNGIPKKINYTFDDNFQFTELSVDLKFINKTHKLEIRTQFDNNLNLVFIDYSYINKYNNKIDNKSLRKATYTKIHYNCYQIDNPQEENRLAKCHIAEFIHPELFFETFPEFSVGPLQNPLSIEDIDRRLLLLNMIDN